LFDTIIIGAGPVGSYIASKLAGMGHKILVLEKKSVAGQDTCCTGIISKECRSLLPLNGNTNQKHVNSAMVLSPSGRRLQLSRRDEVAYIIDRSGLEKELMEYAYTRGAEFSFSTHVTDIEQNSDCISVKTNGNGHHHFIEAKSVILATGYGSELYKNFNFGRISDFIIGAQAEVETNAPHEVEIYLNKNIAPGGFAWLVPTDNGRSLAGLMTLNEQEEHLNRLLYMLKDQGKIASDNVSNSYGVIPLKPLPRTYSDRVLVVGEAAGQVKPITGGGIYFGILCADIAANVLDESIMTNDYSAKQLSMYQQQWRKRLRKELIVGYWGHRLLTWLNNTQIEYLFSVAHKKKISESITSSEEFSFDWHSKLLFQLVHTLLPFGNSQNKL
jgi:digeranylgeranylglycerophospholipid reductase